MPHFKGMSGSSRRMRGISSGRRSSLGPWNHTPLTVGHWTHVWGQCCSPLPLGHPAALASLWEGNLIPGFPPHLTTALLLVCALDTFSQLQLNFQISIFMESWCQPLTPLHPQAGSTWAVLEKGTGGLPLLAKSRGCPPFVLHLLLSYALAEQEILNSCFI